jgi:hypothetical protein
MAAIYQWFPGQAVLLTTTLYPVEVIDELRLGISVAGGSLSLVPIDDLQYGQTLTSVDLNQILLDYGPDEDDLQYGQTLTSVDLLEILLDYGPDTDDLQYGQTLVSVELANKLVIGDTPDEKLQLSCGVYPSGCSMTPV